MTKREMFNIAINTINGTAIPEKEEVLAGLRHEIELLDSRKSSKRSTPTKNQKENAVIMERIYDALVDIGNPVTVTELLNHGIEGYELTNQRASALLRQLKDEGRVVKTTDKRKSLFAVA